MSQTNEEKYQSEWEPDDEEARHILLLRTLQKLAVKSLHGLPGTWVDLDRQDVQQAIDDTFVLHGESAQAQVYAKRGKSYPNIVGYRMVVEALKALLPMVEALHEVPDIRVQQARKALAHAEGQP